jgi:hypothetical protein
MKQTTDDIDEGLLVDIQRTKLQTKGYVERLLLNALHKQTNHDPPRDRTFPQGVADVYDDVNTLGGRAWKDHKSVKASIRRAFGQLRDKGLVETVDEADFRRRPNFYGVSEQYEPDDGRVTKYVLTKDGVDEIRSLDKLYCADLHKIMRRYGRVDPLDRIGVAKTSGGLVVDKW